VRAFHGEVFIRRFSQIFADLGRGLIGVVLLSGISALAQESSPSPRAAAAVSATAAPVVSGTTALSPASSSPSPAPSLLKKTGVKIQFIPPPMEGTISLGIYDDAGKLVRVLHRAASGDEFVAALDGYITHWDGLDDHGQPAPAGHYNARGYMVGGVTIRALETGSSQAVVAAPAIAGSGTDSAAAPVMSGPAQGLAFPDGKPFAAQQKIHVGLEANPLNRDMAGNADLTVITTPDGCWLALSDGLPLKQVSGTRQPAWAGLGRSAPGEPLIAVVKTGAVVEQYAITKITDMMAFDCGGFDYTPGAQ
jgi:hypothetical protein